MNVDDQIVALQEQALEDVEAASWENPDLEFDDVASIIVQRVWNHLYPELAEFRTAEGWGTHCKECGSMLQENFDLSQQHDKDEIAKYEMNNALNNVVNLIDAYDEYITELAEDMDDDEWEEWEPPDVMSMLREVAMKGIHRGEVPDAVADIHWKTRVRDGKTENPTT